MLDSLQEMELPAIDRVHLQIQAHVNGSEEKLTAYNHKKGMF